MNKLLLSLFVFGLFSCQVEKKKEEVFDKENLTIQQVDSILEEFNFIYDTPIFLDSSDQVLIPISTKLLKKRKRYSLDGYSMDGYNRYWNVMFYNRLTGDSKLLTEEKIRISELNTNARKHNAVFKDKILYTVGDIDNNFDGKLNSEDPLFLFASNTDGSNLERVSPKNEHLEYYNIIPNTNSILLKTLRDVNNDSLFNNKDESIWYNASFRNENWKHIEIIDSLHRKKIENLYFDQWLQKR